MKSMPDEEPPLTTPSAGTGPALSPPAGTAVSGEFDRKRQEVDRLIAELSRKGALDEGTADVLDRLIDAWHAQQASRIHEHFLDRQRLGLEEVGRFEARLRKAELTLEDARRAVRSPGEAR